MSNTSDTQQPEQQLKEKVNKRSRKIDNSTTQQEEEDDDDFLAPEYTGCRFRIRRQCDAFNCPVDGHVEPPAEVLRGRSGRVLDTITRRDFDNNSVDVAVFLLLDPVCDDTENRLISAAMTDDFHGTPCVRVSLSHVRRCKVLTQSRPSSSKRQRREHAVAASAVHPN